MKTAYDDCTYFSSTQKGIPQVANGKIDLLLALDACLVNGFNENMGVARVVGDDTVIEFGVTHGYLSKSMLLVNKDGIAKKCRVYQADSHSITLKNVKITGDVTVKVAPLGFTSLFDTSHKTQRAYRGRGGRVLYLNSEPLAGMTLHRESPAVVVRANICDDMQELGVMINPLNNAVIDELFWAQKVNSTIGNAIDKNTVDFCIVGNEYFFYFFINGNSLHKQPFMFGFGDMLATGSYDTAFLLANHNKNYATSDYFSNYQTANIGNTASVWVVNNWQILSLGLGPLQSGNTGGSFPNADNLFFAMPLRVLDKNSNTLGFMPNLLFVNHQMSQSHHLQVIDDVLLLSVIYTRNETNRVGHFGFYLGDV